MPRAVRKREEDPSAKRLGTYQSAPAKRRGPTVTSKADVKKGLKAGAKKVVKTLLPVAMRGSAAGPLGRAAGFLGMRTLGKTAKKVGKALVKPRSPIRPRRGVGGKVYRALRKPRK